MNYWYWAQSKCTSLDYELVSWQLFETGIGALEEVKTDEKFTYFRFFCEDIALRDKIISEFSQFPWEFGQDEAKDWDKFWKDRQVPVQVCEDLWIRPPWVEYQGKKDDVILQLEAKMAFGTGEHESTRMIAGLMQKLDLNNKTILDIGTGTGILTMYGLRKGAKNAIFTEIDPTAIPCIIENFKLNDIGIPKGILGGLESLNKDKYFDVIMCNMIKTEFWPLKKDIMRLLKANGIFLLSGQLLIDRDFLMNWAKEEDLKLVYENSEKEWWAVAFQEK